jgi:hypothetical protein
MQHVQRWWDNWVQYVQPRVQVHLSQAGTCGKQEQQKHMQQQQHAGQLPVPPPTRTLAARSACLMRCRSAATCGSPPPWSMAPTNASNSFLTGQAKPWKPGSCSPGWEAICRWSAPPPVLCSPMTTQQPASSTRLARSTTVGSCSQRSQAWAQHQSTARWWAHTA